jgi:hypothetical protein
VINIPDVPGFESVNGLQLAPIPEPTTGALALAAVVGAMHRRRSR